jgi:signal transduction histidine kinase
MESSVPWYRSRSVVAFLFVVLATMAIGTIVYETIQWRRVVAFKTGETRFDLRILLVSVLDEERAIGGFGITGERLFLQSYEDANQRFDATLAETRRDARLGRLFGMQPDLDTIAALHARWEHEVAEPILLVRPHAYVQTGAASTYLIDAMRSRIARSTELTVDALDRGIVEMRVALILVFTTIIVVSAIVGLLALRSERRRADREGQFARRLAASNDELRQQRSSVLALNQVKNDLIALLAHDIKGPLTSVSGFAELLKDGVLEGEDAVDAARRIHSNAQQLTTLAEDVLMLSRIEHGELEISHERIDVVVLVRSVAGGHLTERTVNVTANAQSAFVLGDDNRLRQVVENLLRNALKYSPDKSPVDIHVEAAKDRVSIAIRDYGIGIPPEDLSRLFRRFGRAWNAHASNIAGTGMGLFIVKTIAERHGGTVAVESTLGEGSCFTVTLPAVDVVAARRLPCVTIVTNDTDLREFTAYELRSRGYRVQSFRSMADLVRDANFDPGDVVVVDSAIATARDVRTFIPSDGIRIIGLDGDSSNRSGWSATLPQPFLATELIAAVRREAV